MGVRRLRNRLDQLQGKANATMGTVQALMEELSDGFAVELEVTPGAAPQLLEILQGRGGKLPIRLRILPEE